jgi:hypothetical protein
VKPLVDDRLPPIRPGARSPQYGRAIGRSYAGGAKRKPRQARRRQRQ